MMRKITARRQNVKVALYLKFYVQLTYQYIRDYFTYSAVTDLTVNKMKCGGMISNDCSAVSTRYTCLTCTLAIANSRQ